MIIIFSMAKGPRLAVSMGSSLETQEVFCAAGFFLKHTSFDLYIGHSFHEKESSGMISYVFFQIFVQNFPHVFFWFHLQWVFGP